VTEVITTFAQLDKIRAGLLMWPHVAAPIAKKIAPIYSAYAQSDFDSQQSPYGDNWDAGASGESIDLVETGKLRGVAIKYSSAGRQVFTNTSAVKYTRYHINKGLFPRAKALPAKWFEAMREAALSELRKYFDISV
jgi:hypothetical protein